MGMSERLMVSQLDIQGGERKRLVIDEMTEREWQQQVVALARTLGYLVFHTHDSRRSQPGFPDLCCVGRKVVYLELKRQDGKLTDHQEKWLAALRRAGAEAYVLRPSDLDLVGRILTERRARGVA